jgi:type IV fimbrial biogenesis protein FimT
MGTMVIILSLVAIVGVSGWSFVSASPPLHLNSAKRQIIADLMAARMGAVDEDNDYKIFFLSDYHYQILDDDNNDGVADAGEWTLIRDIQDDYPDVTLAATVDPVFTPRGFARSLGTITLTNSSGTKNLFVGRTGRVAFN